MRTLAVVIVSIAPIILGLILFNLFNRNQTTSAPSPSNSLPSPSVSPQSVSVIATQLDTPWSLVFLPDKSILITQRPGQVRLVSSTGDLSSNPVLTLSDVSERGEGGLLGITISPDFSQDNLVFLYYTYQENNSYYNRVAKFTFTDNRLTNQQNILNRIPASANHNGGRLKFGPDGFLYITTGDADKSDNAQDKNSLAGKILRITPDGQLAPGNPFGNQVYSYGHRNPQGLAWDNQNRLWSTEHGRSGISTGLDEVNLIQLGQNYGWPDIQGNQTQNGMQPPIINSGTDTTWAPSGVAYLNNSLYFGGLRGQSLYRATIDGDRLILQSYFQNQFGRIRDVVLGPDNFIYLITSNRDGRGDPSSEDDRLIRIDPAILAN